ncbi:MAG: thrombospondin type 3 repeat-containing protein [Planctomycetes bacterium]|nr:thrombospondin type 3 repeat-containing protein [Planctomycetota bacterium]
MPVARAFLNGIQTSETSFLQNGQPIPSLPLCTNNATVLIGGLPPFPNNYLDGKIEELRIWNIARSQSDIQSTMNRRLTGLEPGLVAYYRFDEGSGTTATNLATGYGVGNGTLVNGTAWASSTAPIFAPNPTNDCNANGIPDDCDIESGISQDCNSNGIPDSCEPSGNDCNNNGVLDSCDIASGSSSDCNQDQIPDECQPVLDADGDGIQDGCDNCPSVVNPDQANNDNDAFGNACDNCPNTFNLTQIDSDGDGLGDLCDNCPGVVNPGQEDCDNDGYGDACGCSAERGDMNGDGLVNALDTQLFVERLLRP